MNNWCICWFFTYVLLGILIFKGLTARLLYNSFGVKGLKAGIQWRYYSLSSPEVALNVVDSEKY
jgi:hypothetical protein